MLYVAISNMWDPGIAYDIILYDIISYDEVIYGVISYDIIIMDNNATI